MRTVSILAFLPLFGPYGIVEMLSTYNKQTEPVQQSVSSTAAVEHHELLDQQP